MTQTNVRDKLADLIDEVAEVRGEHISDHAVLQNADEIADAILKQFPSLANDAPAPAPSGMVRETELVRAASALLSNLWQDVWSHDRTHEENWKAFDRKFPGVKWLRDARDAALTPIPLPERGGSQAASQGRGVGI